jgi:collagenase-like PrtC family protease
MTESLRKYLSWIVDDFNANALVIASNDLMKLVRKEYRDAEIFVSTIAGVRNWQDAEKYLPIEPKRIIVHHDTNRNFKDLEYMVEKANKNGVDVEVMLTESCLRHCPVRDEHYEWVGKGKDDHGFHSFCNTEKIMAPREMLKANFIRPEDIEIYENMGVKHFKITGRSKRPEWLPEVVKAYVKRNYEGNLMRLLGIDPNLNAEDWIFINNKSLDGFLSAFPQSGNVSDEDRFSDEWATKLFQDGNLQIRSNDYTYAIENVSLVCKDMKQQVYTIPRDIDLIVQLKRLDKK